MDNLKDLNIKKELLPLFDYSLNSFAKAKITDILLAPLPSVQEIMQRQDILKGFAANHKILNDYSYSPLYLNEVYAFLKDIKKEDRLQKKISYQLFTPAKEKIRYTGRCNQLILLFYHLESKCFSRLDLSQFPKRYQSKIKQILTFLSKFELHKYEKIVREDRLKDKHIVELSEKINALRKDKLITLFWENLFQFEAFLSINEGIRKNEFTFPEFTDNYIKLVHFYHPLIKNPIKNNFETKNNVIVLNGPNMSGKSTFLKAVGLCIYLGHLGIGIPASFAEIPFIDYFFININRKNDILQGYSHFMNEVMALKKVVIKAKDGKRCFVVFDELFSGTNIEDGFDICKTTINGLSKYENSYFLISTHIQKLKEISNEKVSNYYLDCEIKGSKPKFTYQLKKGWSDLKVGSILFNKEGLNDLLK